jgi:hypothetical protein
LWVMQVRGSAALIGARSSARQLKCAPAAGRHSGMESRDVRFLKLSGSETCTYYARWVVGWRADQERAAIAAPGTRSFGFLSARVGRVRYASHTTIHVESTSVVQ